MKKPIDLRGKRFGRLTVVKPSESVKNAWLCRCDCGGKARVQSIDLRIGKRVSCGCLAVRATCLKVKVGKISPVGRVEELEDLIK